MRQLCRVSLLGATVVSALSLLASGQDAPSLGDAARSARQQKQQQSKDSQGKDRAKNPKVITNEEIPAHPAPAATSSSPGNPLHEVSYTGSGGAKIPAEQWRAQIQAQKNLVSSLQSDVDRLNDSIHFTSANCVSNCVQWNERQKEKQQEVERMRAQLDDQRKRLEDMQESARQQGYGSSVYEP